MLEFAERSAKAVSGSPNFRPDQNSGTVVAYRFTRMGEVWAGLGGIGPLRVPQSATGRQRDEICNAAAERKVTEGEPSARARGQPTDEASGATF